MSDLEIKKTYGLFDNPLNKKLIAELQSRGEEVLIFPSVAARRLDLNERVAEKLKNINEFDWLVLTDVLAADFFIGFLEELEIDFFELDDLTVCALGEAVADRLRFVQVHADVIPPKTSDDAVFQAISNYAGVEINDLRFLIVRENSARWPFIEKLKAEDAFVEELRIYSAELTGEAASTKLKTLLAGGAVDEFVFSAPEDLLGLRILAENADPAALLNETRVSAVGEMVFQSLQEHGFRPLYFHYK